VIAMKKETILIVEDNEMNMDIATQLLEMEGYSVLKALDGPSCIKIATTRSPALILMDMQMPGQDGFAVTRMIKENPTTKDIKVVAFTALVMEEDRRNALECGCAGVITKPIEVEKFADLIGTFLTT
jgi:CheY-like chemotaxis protein